jgi:trehalose 6-phosphate phosphatase
MTPASGSAPEGVDRLRELKHRAGIFLDFDGTLSEIVARPEQARPVPEALVVLLRLTASYRLVAVVSGRPSAEVRARLDLPGIEVFGLYGFEAQEEAPAVRVALLPVEEAATTVPGAWVEDKGASVAVHYRAAPDPVTAERELRARLDPLAAAHGLRLVPGKMVLELAPLDTPGKGGVVLREARARALAGCLYAGDDLADVEAFAALDELRGMGVQTVKVAVRSAEAPQSLVEAADVVVDGPSGLVQLLARL